MLNVVTTINFDIALNWDRWRLPHPLRLLVGDGVCATLLAAAIVFTCGYALYFLFAREGRLYPYACRAGELLQDVLEWWVSLWGE